MIQIQSWAIKARGKVTAFKFKSKVEKPRRDVSFFFTCEWVLDSMDMSVLSSGIDVSSTVSSLIPQVWFTPKWVLRRSPLSSWSCLFVWREHLAKKREQRKERRKGSRFTVLRKYGQAFQPWVWQTLGNGTHYREDLKWSALLLEKTKTIKL